MYFSRIYGHICHCLYIFGCNCFIIPCSAPYFDTYISHIDLVVSLLLAFSVFEKARLCLLTMLYRSPCKQEKVAFTDVRASRLRASVLPSVSIARTCQAVYGSYCYLVSFESNCGSIWILYLLISCVTQLILLVRVLYGIPLFLVILTQQIFPGLPSLGKVHFLVLRVKLLFRSSTFSFL